MHTLIRTALAVLALTAVGCGDSGISPLTSPPTVVDALTPVPPPPVAKACARNTAPEASGMPSEARIYSWIEGLVKLGYRRTGTPAGYAASAYVKCQFESLGLEDVHYETSTSWSWEATKSSVKVNGETIDAFPSAFSFVTPDKPSLFTTGPDGLTAEIVDINLGTPIEQQLKGVKGKVILFDLKFLLPTAGLAPLMEFLWDPDLSLVDPSILIANPYVTTYREVLDAAMAAGAVGFVGVLADYFDSNRYYNEFYRRSSVTIPGYWVTSKEGTRLRALLQAKGGPSTANLVMEGSRKAVEARSVVGFLPGKSKETIMVQSHHDAVFDGAVEDGSGTAAVLAQAQYYAAQPAASRERTMMFATFDTHFTGYQAHIAFADKYVVKKATPYTLVANVTLEHIAKQAVKGSNGELVITKLPELRGIMNNFGVELKAALIGAVVEHDLRRTAVLSVNALCSVVGIPTDASFMCLNGVPTASLIAGPLYLYDAADTLDKVDRAQLVPVTETFIDIIDKIDDTPTDRIGTPLPSLGPALNL
ncbi:MAG: M28 family peptidase [Stagnimonas sp.]|nr:M28 family peptidase [Stagnimonas sp.]